MAYKHFSINDLLNNPAAKQQLGRIHTNLLIVSNYVKAHEVFLGVILALALVWGLSGKVQDVITAHDKRQYDAAQIARINQADNNARQAQVNAQIATENARLAAEYKTLAQQTQDQNTKLAQANVALSSSLRQQQAHDATLAPPALAQRIETLAALPSNSIAAASDNSFTVPNVAAVQIAQALEHVPILQQQVINLEAQSSNKDNLLSKQDTVVAALNKQVDGLATERDGLKREIKAADDAHKKEIKLVKDLANKGKRKWFVAGYIAGLATRGLVKIFGSV
jgi:hypothetical protein